jgi:hypothetical protein
MNKQAVTEGVNFTFTTGENTSSNNGKIMNYIFDYFYYQSDEFPPKKYVWRIQTNMPPSEGREGIIMVVSGTLENILLLQTNEDDSVSELAEYKRIS